MRNKETRWCPAPDCGYAVLADQNMKRCPEIRCGRPGCNTSYCYKCKLKWHPGMSCKRNRQVVAQENIMIVDEDDVDGGVTTPPLPAKGFTQSFNTF